MIEMRKTEIFAKWLDGLKDLRARARILVQIERLGAGNHGDVKPVGEGVSELRINYGPGYRVYYKQQGEKVVILLAAVISALRLRTSKPPCALLTICRELS